MTHVCRSWRNVLISTPSLWTHINFSVSAKSQQAEVFIHRSGNQLLDIYQYLPDKENAEPFLSITPHNLFRLQGLSIISYLSYLGPLLRKFSASAPELKHLEISSQGTMKSNTKLPNIFGGRMSKLTSLSLQWFHTDLRDLDLPSLTRFDFTTEKDTSIQDLISFFERCPSLEFIQITLIHPPQTPTPPPRRRVCLATLRELRLDNAAYAAGLLDQLILPKCTEMMLEVKPTGETLTQRGLPAVRIHPSSIDHLPVTGGITKAVMIQNSCTFSGPSGNLRFLWLEMACRDIDIRFFTSFSPISVLQIRELWIGQRTVDRFSNRRTSWRQTAAGLRGALGVLTDVEGLTVVYCDIEPFLETLGETVDDGLLLPALQRLTFYVGRADIDVPALIQCTKARKKHFRPLEELTVIWDRDPGAEVRDEVEPLREFVGRLVRCVGEAPKFFWRGDECGWWG